MNPDRFEGVLFTPPGKTTRIQKKDFPLICEYLKPGDRIAWHRPYMLIHEATVIHVSQNSGKILVAEVHKDNPLGGELQIKEIILESQFGELYRYDYDRELVEDEKIIKELVSRLGNNFGYSIFAENCQHMTERTHTGRQGSYQTRWFFLSKVLIEPVWKPFFAELFEYLYNAKNELIGLVGTVVLHVATFLTKFVVAYRKLKGGRITWVHFTTLIFKEFVTSLGNIVLQYVAYRFKMNLPTTPSFLHVCISFVLAFMGACILDALLLWSGLVSSDSSLRYVIHGVGAIIGFGIGMVSTGWVLEFLFAAVLGFTAQLVAHGLYHAGSWLYSWLKGEGVDSRVVNDIRELKEGDYITNYEHWYHRSCHAIFVSVVDEHKKMIRVIKNTYSEGVVEKNIPFRKGNVYKYLYNSSECRPDWRVLEVARLKIGGPNTYSWFTNNCKTFAKYCKCGIGSGAPSSVNKALKGVNVTSIIDDLLADEGLSEDRREIYTSLKLSIIECQ